MAERILQALACPAAIEDQIVRTSASLGIAAGSPECTATSLLRDADVAMYRAKMAGKAQWVVYDATMRTAAVERLQLETDLIRALDDDQFVLVYQPVVELETDRVVGFEALIRWHHPTLGVVPPDSFIPLAEESGLILPIGAWVLDEACRTAARWRLDYPEHARLSMAVNLSGHQLGSPDLVGQVQRALARSGLDPANLVLEMTETALIRDPATTAAKLRELRALGIRLAIDDFGTGYSSLSYLRQFPIDILKIDSSFIDGITERDKVPALVRGLLDLARTLQLETIAEGVENGLQRDRLREEHCDRAQGYLFAPPLGAADAEALLIDLDPAGPHLPTGSVRQPG
jgi:EAL domain-containing protein (putative c-di-GMP-specific phosphodiesterase class I)